MYISKEKLADRGLTITETDSGYHLESKRNFDRESWQNFIESQGIRDPGAIEYMWSHMYRGYAGAVFLEVIE